MIKKVEGIGKSIMIGVGILIMLSIAACGGGGGGGGGGTEQVSSNDDNVPSPVQFSISGSLTGLDLGQTVVLWLNESDSLSISATGNFSFELKLNEGAEYSVTVQTQPIDQTCAVTNGAGTVGDHDITTVDVVCTDNPPDAFSLSGTASGLDGTVTLNVGTESLAVDTNGTFEFVEDFAEGEGFSVSIAGEPAHQACTLNATSGTFTSEDYTTLELSCHDLIVYRTSGQLNGSQGIGSADSLCQSDIYKPSGGHTYKAMLVDGTNRIACETADCSGGIGENKDWVFKPNKEYRQENGTTVLGTTNSKGIFEFPLENGMIGFLHAFRTGLNANWTTGSNCNGFTSNAGTDYGRYGNGLETGTGSISSGSMDCNQSMWMLCVRQ